MMVDREYMLTDDWFLGDLNVSTEKKYYDFKEEDIKGIAADIIWPCTQSNIKQKLSWLIMVPMYYLVDICPKEDCNLGNVLKSLSIMRKDIDAPKDTYTFMLEDYCEERKTGLLLYLYTKVRKNYDRDKRAATLKYAEDLVREKCAKNI